MFYKAVIFDLDNTLYDYDYCHNKALKEIFKFINEKNGINVDILSEEYNKASFFLKCELKNTASSHNKMIYFKRMIESLNLNLNLLKIINEMYWSIFLDNIKCFDFVENFIKWNKTINIKIGILTDYQLEYQILKLEKLGLINYIDCILTSEEIGIEKPSSYGFLLLLNKMNLKFDEAIFIGDDYEKDIVGSNNLNIKSYHFNKNEFFYKKILNNFKNINEELKNLKKLSLYCGERIDLVQAGGGNISVKINNIDNNNLMIIKSSGIQLSNVNENNGYSIIDNDRLIKDINDNKVSDVIQYNYFGNNRSSIETYMHSFLKKYTVHLHPIQINKILIAKDSKILCKELYSDSLIIDYYTPGIKLADIILKKYHGVIFTSDNYEEIYELIENTINKFESYLSLDFNHYKHTNYISRIINNIYNCSNITYLCQNIIIKKYLIMEQSKFNYNISFPDSLIYCGYKVCFNIFELDINKERPNIIIYQNEIYINNHSLNKCKEIEEVLFANLLILDTEFEKNCLSENEIKYLSNWESEKFRKNI